MDMMMASVVCLGDHLTFVSKYLGYLDGKRQWILTCVFMCLRRTCSSAALQKWKTLNLQSGMEISSVHSTFCLTLTLLNVKTTFTATCTKTFRANNFPSSVFVGLEKTWNHWKSLEFLGHPHLTVHLANWNYCLSNCITVRWAVFSMPNKTSKLYYYRNSFYIKEE